MQILDGKQKNLLRFQEFFIKNRKFHSEFANYLQNAVIFVNNSQEICRTRLISSIIREKFAERSEFRQKFTNYLQKTANFAKNSRIICRTQRFPSKIRELLIENSDF